MFVDDVKIVDDNMNNYYHKKDMIDSWQRIKEVLASSKQICGDVCEYCEHKQDDNFCCDGCGETFSMFVGRKLLAH